ncbi:hypothetical protein [Burkholderia gladioli]|uniref:Uncharacterized protein n=1 Tax=Burkholderia gladioli TaxID=28095 RepID=A0AB38TW18_BURGA|nr:hypothetical protein [Burkholderia gladioli]ASD78905.1 hypothetical protein CEJ98_07740 [Burkholderia gladioli pv. gladioli]AWY55847.1 hypothetical protein A8H28_33405 [Burkholderia gladioli pv. gladioli]MBU9189671.1 hypothetical protein [Burkholderia gladioli]MBU9271274.1 hypothetical protein [Burkholderia gladioli]MBU9277988.1 hypothetical protein [Burkholderia gladioli]
MDENVTLIRVFAGTASDGSAVCEELPARKIDEDVYELLASPGLALNRFAILYEERFVRPAV